VTGPVAGRAYKVGVITTAGWVAFVRGGEALVSSAPFEPDASYAEDGANVTFFESDDPKRAWCEIEQVGPLRELGAGGVARLSETLELLDVEPPRFPEPDALRQAIESARGPRPATRPAK
jgi:hypothetical protein